MTATIAQEAEQVQLLTLSPSDVTAHPKNPRSAITDLGGMVDSVKQLGVLEPVVVAPWPSDVPTKSSTKREGYVLIAGHRRHAAAKQAKVRLPAIYRPDLSTLAAQVEAMLVENIHRQDLSPVEEGDGYQTLLDLDFTQSAIADKVGRPKRAVSERLRVARLPEPARVKLHERQITLDAALGLAEFNDDPEAQASLMRTVGTCQFDGMLHDLRGEKRAKSDRVKTRKALEKAGVTVLDEFPDDGPCADLEEALDGYCDTALAKVAEHTGVDLNVVSLEDVADWHAATCPGHVVVDTGVRPGWGSDRRYEFQAGCATPDVHATTDPDDEPAAGQGGGGDDRVTDEGAAAREAQQVGLAEAATVRRRHVADLLSGDLDVDVAELAAVARATLQSVAKVDLDRLVDGFGYKPGNGAAAVRVMFGLPCGEGNLTEVERDELLGLFETQSIEWCVVAGQVLVYAASEGSIDHPDDLRRTSGLASGWLTWLRSVAGYSWTDFEAEHVPDWLKAAPSEVAEAS